MKVFLMHPDRDLDLEAPLVGNGDSLVQDLELDTVFDAMSGGDPYVREIVERALLTEAGDPELIPYRQSALADCLAQPEVVRRLYALAVEGVDATRQARVFWFRDSPDMLLNKSLTMLGLLGDLLKKLRSIADEHAGAFSSDAFVQLFATIERELDDGYLAVVDEHLHELRFRHGVLISAGLGRGNRGTGYVLRKRPKQRLLERLTPSGRSSYSFYVPPRDEHGMDALATLRNRGVRLVANALAQATDHIQSFFGMLRAELAFYLGSLNLHEQLVAKGQPTCFGEPRPAEEYAFACTGLYDAALAFHLDAPVVGNAVDLDGKRLVMITGANQGGKSTFLRSVGLAQLMLQAGMFVPAEALRASVTAGTYTHFKREEDATMTSGKLDEELARMSEIADRIGSRGLLLCNESFAATNEREGSEIAQQLIRAMVEAGVRVFFVTHLFELADGLHRRGLADAAFLRAERRDDGTRTFRVLPGRPLQTSFGADSYRRVFGDNG